MGSPILFSGQFNKIRSITEDGRVSTSWIILVAIVAAGISIGGYLQISQLFLSEKLQQRIFTNASFGFAYRLPRLNTDDMSNKFVPELVNQFFDAINLQKGMSKILMEFTTASIQVIFGLILLSLYHPFFILFGIILLAILVMIFYLACRYIFGMAPALQWDFWGDGSSGG